MGFCRRYGVHPPLFTRHRLFTHLTSGMPDRQPWPHAADRPVRFLIGQSKERESSSQTESATIICSSSSAADPNNRQTDCRIRDPHSQERTVSPALSTESSHDRFPQRICEPLNALSDVSNQIL